MKTKEKLERAGWVFLFTVNNYNEVYGRGDMRIFYNTVNDNAFAYYEVPLVQPYQLQNMTEEQLDLFTQKLQ
jgi:hypothetical protein